MWNHFKTLILIKEAEILWSFLWIFIKKPHMKLTVNAAALYGKHYSTHFINKACGVAI